MKRLKAAVSAAIAASFIALAPATFTSPAIAQVGGTADTASLAGDWSGALDVQGVQLRLVLHVTSADGKTTATLDSLDQGAMAIPVSSVSRTGDKLAFEVAVVGGNYDGAISADGKTATGTWTQGANALPLMLKRP